MSKLSNFNDQPIVVHDDKTGVELLVYPIPAKQSHLFNQLGKGSDESKNNAVNELIKASLRDEKDINKEELESMTTRVQNLIMDAIIEVNGYSEKVEDARQKFIATKSRETSE